MRLTKNSPLLSKHSIAIITSLIVFIVLNVGFLIFFYWPALQTNEDRIDAERRLTSEVALLSQTILAHEAQLQNGLEEIGIDENQPTLPHWQQDVWKSEFGLFVTALEREHGVLFTDLIYNDQNGSQVIVQTEAGANIELMEETFSLVLGGGLHAIADTIDDLYEMPVLFEIVSWDLQPQQLSVAPVTSDEEQYVLKMECKVKFMD